MTNIKAYIEELLELLLEFGHLVEPLLLQASPGAPLTGGVASRGLHLGDYNTGDVIGQLLVLQRRLTNQSTRQEIDVTEYFEKGH